MSLPVPIIRDPSIPTALIASKKVIVKDNWLVSATSSPSLPCCPMADPHPRDLLVQVIPTRRSRTSSHSRRLHASGAIGTRCASFVVLTFRASFGPASVFG